MPPTPTFPPQPPLPWRCDGATALGRVRMPLKWGPVIVLARVPLPPPLSAGRPSGLLRAPRNGLTRRGLRVG